MSEVNRATSRAFQWAFLGGNARCRRIVISWSAAGGITLGGLVVGFAAIGSPETAQGLLPLAPVLFLVGVLAGLVHGAVLAYLGRSEEVGGSAAVAAVGSGILLSVPALVVAWVATAWISLTPALFSIRAWSTTLLAGAGWIAGVAACCWAAVEGWEALCLAMGRWPERRPGLLLLVVAAAVLAVALVRHRPGIWGTDLRLTGAGAVILALVSTLWVALPIVVLLLRYLHRRFASVWDGPTAGKKIVQPDL